MAELVQLERRHDDFARRNTRVIVVSVEGPTEAQLTKDQFKHLLVLDDARRGLCDAAALIHAHAGPGGSDIAMPTTILVDRTGTVRWLFRPDAVITRLSPDEVLSAVDQHLPAKP